MMRIQEGKWSFYHFMGSDANLTRRGWTERDLMLI